MTVPKHIKYVLHPGHVTSQTDGQRHYITSMQLAKLYGVSLRECWIVRSGEFWAGGRDTDRLIHLYPRYDGDYTLPVLKDGKEK